MIKNSVGIIGCGWLGKALTKELVSQQYKVCVSTQHEEKISALLQLGGQVERFILSSKKPTAEDFKLLLFKKSCLVIAIPPGIRQGKSDYPDKIKNIVTLAESGDVKQLIMISTTAIYNGLTGDIDENALLDTSSEKTNIIHLAEKHALAFNGSTVILRLSGLVGPDRHPGKFLRGNRLLSDPDATTNLIHQKDAVGLLLELISTRSHTAIYNGSSRTHVSKKEYYEKAAISIGLPKPQFNEQKYQSKMKEEVTPLVPNKVITSNKIRDAFNYTFYYDNLLAWLEDS